MALAFKTISPDLAEYADLAAAQAKADGYRLTAEPAKPFFPVTPTILGEASQRELIVEVVAKVSFSGAQKWLAYGRAQQKDTRVRIVAPPQKKSVDVSEIAKFQDVGIGLYIGDNGRLVELVASIDLSTQIVCPDLSSDRIKIKRKLEPCFAKVRRGDAVDGFKDLAVIIEAAARQRLIEGVKSGRVTFASSTGKPLTYATKDIKRGTMGWLKDRYGEIVKPNGADNLVFQAFSAIGADRNLASHNVLTPASRRAMNKRIAMHLLVLHQAARQLF